MLHHVSARSGLRRLSRALDALMTERLTVRRALVAVTLWTSFLMAAILGTDVLLGRDVSWGRVVEAGVNGLSSALVFLFLVRPFCILMYKGIR